MSELVIIRGLPGSGKSTYAKNQYPNHKHYEADQWFVDGNGNYNFNANELGQAHKACFGMCDAALAHKLDVVVSNTFTTLKELTPYIELAKTHKSRLIIISMYDNYGSVHNVPEETINKMKARWYDVDKYSLDYEYVDVWNNHDNT